MSLEENGTPAMAPAEATTPVESPAIAPPSAPAAAPPPAEPESYADKLAAQEKALDDDLRATFRKASAPETERAPDGKFAAKPGTEVAPVIEPPKVEAPKAPAPRSWPKEMVDKFGALPPEVQQYVSQREAETHKAISSLGQQVKALEPIQKVLDSNRATFERNGTTYEQGIAALVAAQNALDQNPENGIAYLAQTYGVDLRGLVQKIYGGMTDQNGLSPDPEVMALKSELAQMKRQQEYERSQQTANQKAATEARERQERAGYESHIENFAKDKADFYDVAPDVLANLVAIQQTSPGLPPDQILQQAYDRAIWANPKTREAKIKSEEARRLAEAAKLTDPAKRANGINVKGRPKTAEAGTLDDDLRAVFRKNNAR